MGPSQPWCTDMGDCDGDFRVIGEVSLDDYHLGQDAVAGGFHGTFTHRMRAGISRLVTDDQ